MASRHGLGERRLAGFLAERAEFDFLPDELPDDLGAAETRRIGERSLAITINGVHISPLCDEPGGDIGLFRQHQQSPAVLITAVNVYPAPHHSLQCCQITFCDRPRGLVLLISDDVG